jgi:hypothetical protein
MVAAVDKLLGDPVLRSAMSAASLARAEDLSIDTQATRLVAIYEDLLSKHPSPRRGGIETTAVGKRVIRQMGSLRRRGNRLVRRYL